MNALRAAAFRRLEFVLIILRAPAAIQKAV